MHTKKRNAFTLVELLVVIVIIGMLVGLMTPAIIAARERARCIQCMNHMKNLGDGLVQFDLARSRFPGYANMMPGQALPVSWAVMVLPYIQKNDVWDQFRRQNLDPANPEPFQAVGIEIFACPSDPETEQYQQSYVVNCGQKDFSETGANPTVFCQDWSANGVFLYHPTTNGKHVTAARIADGAQHTLLLSENLQATHWITEDLTDPNVPIIRTLSEDLTEAEDTIGMLWWPDFKTLTKYPPNVINWIQINGEDEDDTNLNPEHKARPSSNHPGGVNVIFCGGHAQFLHEDIDYDVYARLMTPDGKNAAMAADANTGAGEDTKQDTPLDADDYIN